MTDEELEHRLTAVENRAQSNTHRLDELGKLTDAVNGMNTNIKLTIQQLENTNKIGRASCRERVSSPV